MAFKPLAATECQGTLVTLEFPDVLMSKQFVSFEVSRVLERLGALVTVVRLNFIVYTIHMTLQ